MTLHWLFPGVYRIRILGCPYQDYGFSNLACYDYVFNHLDLIEEKIIDNGELI